MPALTFLIKPSEQKQVPPSTILQYTMNILARNIYTNDLLVYVYGETVGNLAKFSQDYPTRRVHSGEIPEEEANMWERLAFPEREGNIIQAFLDGIEEKRIKVEQRSSHGNPLKRD